MDFGNISDFTTDPDMEMEGIDLSFGDGRFITVRRAGGSNKTFANHLAEKFRQNSSDAPGSVSLGDPIIDDSEARQIMYNAYANFVVLDWRGWNDSEGNAIEFSKQNCVDLFYASREIYDHVVAQTNNLNNFRTKGVQESGNE